MDAQRKGAPEPAAAAPPSPPSPPRGASAPAPAAGRPVLPPAIPQFFAPLRGVLPSGSALLYQPRLLGSAQVRFTDTKTKIDAGQEVTVTTEISDAAVPVDWAAAEDFSLPVNDLEKAPIEAEYVACPPVASNAKSYGQWSKDFASWIYGERKLTLFRSRSLERTSTPDESERDFRIRLQQTAREVRDTAAEKLRVKYAPKMAALDDRLRRAQAAREREAQQAKQAKLDTFISFGSTILGAFLGRKAISASTLGKAATTARGVGRSMTQSADVVRADETLEAIQAKIQELEAQFKAETDALAGAIDPSTEDLETIELRASKTNINVRLVALVWLPFLRGPDGVTKPAY
jgi:hypothetical protein